MKASRYTFEIHRYFALNSAQGDRRNALLLGSEPVKLESGARMPVLPNFVRYIMNVPKHM